MRHGQGSGDSSHLARSGTEPRHARSDIGLRLLLSALFAPVFVVAAVLFSLWSAHSTSTSSPSSTVLRVLAAVCAALALTAALDLLVLLRRRRRAPGS